MASSNKQKRGKEDSIDFNKIMKSLLSVPPKENKEVQKKARKERKIQRDK